MSMARKCGCGQGCSCAAESSPSISVDGYGSTEGPFTLGLTPPLEAEDTNTLGLDLLETDTGLQIVAYPTRLVDVQKFTADGTWNKPVWAEAARVIIIAGGGGGGGGAWFNGGTAAQGGSGGASGGVTNLLLGGSELPASAPVVVGAGGSGGAGALVVGTVGGTGGVGGNSSFGSFRAIGGGSGSGGIFSAVTPSGGVASPVGGTVPGASASNAGPYVVERLAPGPGGAGSPSDAGGAPGGHPGGYSLPGKGARTSGYYVTSTIDSPTHGIDELVTLMGSGGAGGWLGPSTTNGALGAGGNGGLYGAGGGGGSAGNLLLPASPGGAGADGYCIVIAW